MSSRTIGPEASRRLPGRRVAERDVVEAEPDRPRAAGHPVLAGVGDVRVDVEHVEHAAPPGDGGLALVDDLRRDQDRLDEER
jgi:hypothetical protein